MENIPMKPQIRISDYYDRTRNAQIACTFVTAGLSRFRAPSAPQRLRLSCIRGVRKLNAAHSAFHHLRRCLLTIAGRRRHTGGTQCSRRRLARIAGRRRNNGGMQYSSWPLHNGGMF